MTEERKDDIKDYLAKIRRTVEQSKDLIQQAERRAQEAPPNRLAQLHAQHRTATRAAAARAGAARSSTTIRRNV